jgi:hypothetical protein
MEEVLERTLEPGFRLYTNIVRICVISCSTDIVHGKSDR